jgi:hypothetical protein
VLRELVGALQRVVRLLAHLLVRNERSPAEYVFVIQWGSDSLEDFDAMVRAEEALCDRLTGRHQVDGHDIGSGEMNIFIFTDDVQAAFAEVKAVLQAESRWEGVRVAWRPTAGERHAVPWPESLREFKVS